jgi:replication initiation and membrane attachment protein DnaB
MDIQKRIRLEQVGVRIDPATRKMVKELAEKYDVRESDIYRSIISSFFAQNVAIFDTICKQDEYNEAKASTVSNDTQPEPA